MVKKHGKKAIMSLSCSHVPIVLFSIYTVPLCVTLKLLMFSVKKYVIFYLCCSSESTGNPWFDNIFSLQLERVFII